MSSTGNRGWLATARHVVLVLGWMAGGSRGTQAQVVRAAATAGIMVDPPVVVSPEGSGDHFFTNIAADPEDPRHLIACGIRARSRANTWQGFVYRSADGGAHWTPALIDTAAQSVSEEACTFGPDQHAYFIAEGWNQPYEWGRLGDGILRLYRSLDAGATWTPVMVDPTHDAWMDFARLAVDQTHGPHRGRLYIFSNDGNTHPPDSVPAEPFRYSIDDGMHISGRVKLPLQVVPFGGFPQSVVVLPSGTVVAAYMNRYTPNGGTPPPLDTTKIMREPPRLNLIQVARSTNGGQSLEPLVTVGRARGFPELAVDASAGPYHGRVYATWTDTVGGVSCVRLATSDDEGKTWTAGRVVDDTRPPAPPRRDSPARVIPDVRDPSVAVNRDGVVGLSWTEDGACWYFSASRDGGRTFLPRVSLNPCPRRAVAAADVNQHLWAVPKVYVTGPRGGRDPTRKGFTVLEGLGGGGANGLTASADGAFHPLWSIATTDGQLWTARVVVQASNVAPDPAPPTSLNGLVDISPRVGFMLTYNDYDVGTGLLSVDLVVANVDSVPIRGPLRVELTGLESGVAQEIGAENAENAARGAGAVWNIDAGPGAAGLAGYGRSTPRRLVFRVRSGAAGARTALDLAHPTALLLIADLKVFASP